MTIEGLPSHVKPKKFDKPKRGEKYIDDEGEVAEAGRDHDNVKRLIVEVAEPSYAERQAAWVKENDLKVGDRVRVLRASKLGEGDWSSAWVPTMNATIGKTLPIKDICSDDILIEFDCGPNVDTAFFPYFVLEKITPTTRPMNRDEFLAAWRERGWCPLVDRGGDFHVVHQAAASAVSTYNIRVDGYGWVSLKDATHFKFASDNSPLTVTE